jgi:hypothetical protein
VQLGPGSIAYHPAMGIDTVGIRFPLIEAIGMPSTLDKLHILWHGRATGSRSTIGRRRYSQHIPAPAISIGVKIGTNRLAHPPVPASKSCVIR